jgi:transcriptional regulator with XRE-family HTH domain
MTINRREVPNASEQTVSERIQEIREMRGLTASELARRVGVTPTAVWNWEKNSVTPRRPVLEAIANVLGVTPAFLLTGNNENGNTKTETAGSVASIVNDARAKLAEATGVPLERIRLDVHFTSE